MKILLEGRRIFEYETDENTRYLIFSNESLKNMCTMPHRYLLKKGTFLILKNGSLVTILKLENY